MHDSYRSLLWYLLAGTKGGPNRVRILEQLYERPYNANQLSETLSMDYRTTRHHLRLLETNRIVIRPIGSAYASPYELSPDVRDRFELIRELRDGGSARAPGAAFPAARPHRRPAA